MECQYNSTNNIFCYFCMKVNEHVLPATSSTDAFKSTVLLTLKIANIRATIRPLGNSPHAPDAMNPMLLGLGDVELQQKQQLPEVVDREDKVSNEPDNIMTDRGSFSDKVKRVVTEEDIDSLVVIFPLPSKDPLLEHRQMFDYAKVFNIGSSPEMLKVAKGLGAKGKGDFLKSQSVFKWSLAQQKRVKVCG